MNSIKKDLLAAALFLLVALAFFFRFLTGSEIFGFRDLSLYFYPLRFLMVEMVKSGTLPLWNPYIYCGIPFFATLQAGFLYPLSLFFYILPFNIGFNWYIIAHYFLAALFMYFLMRHYGLRRISCTASGVIFAFSGYLLSVSNMNTSLTSVIWLPLILLFWDRFADWDPGFLILTLAMMFLGGEPTIFYSTVLIMVIYALFNKTYMKILYLIPILAAAGGLLAVQILPFAEYVFNSVRMWRTDFDFISHSSFPVRETLNFFFPYLWGNFVDGTYVKELAGTSLQTWIISPYIGILSLFLAGLGIFNRQAKIWFFVFTSGFFLLLAFGRYTPVYQLLFYVLPYLSAIRYPVKFLFFPAFAAAALAGWGMEQLEEKINKKMVFAFLSITALIAALWIALKIYFRNIHGMLSPHLAEYYKFVLFKLMSAVQDNLLLLLVILAAAAALITLYYYKKIGGPVLRYGILILIIIDLLAFNYGINPPVSSKLFSNVSANAALLLKDRSLFRYYVDYQVYEKSGTFFSSQDDVLFSLKSKLSPNLMVPHHLQDVVGRESIEPLRNARFYWAFRDHYLDKRLELLSWSNVKYLLSFKKLDHPKLKLISARDYYLYQNLNVYPRAYVDSGSADIIRYEPQRIEINVIAETDTRLIVADNYYPGWKAYIDGRGVNIGRANYLFRSVMVPKGKHMVLFVYDPASVKAGMIISLATILTLIKVSIFVFLRRRMSAKKI